MANEDAHGLGRLLAAARQGDPAALDQLVGRLRALCKALARSWFGHELARQQADSDVAQEAALQVSRQFAAFRGESVPELLAWVRRIAHGSAVDWLRRHRLALPTADGQEPAASWPGPAEQAEQAEEVVRVSAALERLPLRRREVLQLRLIDRLPYATVAQRLGASEGATRVLYVRALEELRQLLEEDEA
jgi:RNA polymerase sigma-70 factor (ECF subfamily)